MTQKNIEHNNTNPFGKIAGVIWQYSNGRHECLVQIDQHPTYANVIIFDSELVTMNFESIATGVFMECLVELYRPDQINFFHKTTLPEDIIAQFGIRTVALEWLKEKKEFTKPSWGKWTPDHQLTNEEVNFLFSMVLGARVGLDKYIEEEIQKNGPLAQTKIDIYNNYKNRIAANGGKASFRLHPTKN